MPHPILAPACVLVLWTIIMLFWMVGTRVPAAARAGINMAATRGGARAADVDSLLPPSVAWKSHNHMHLMEQPTLFYAIVVILALCGGETELNVMLAWGYTVLRVLHSLWQAMVNIVPVRTVLFLGSTICLLVLAVNAARITLGA